MNRAVLVQLRRHAWQYAMPFVAFLVALATVGVAQAETSARDGAVTASTPYCRDQQAPASSGLVDPYFDASIGTTWDDNTTALWSTSGTEGTFNQTWSAAGGGIGALATFQGTAGTVSLSGGVSAGAITFGVSGYTLAGSGSLTLASAGTVTIGSGSGTIAALIAGGGVVKEGGGTLTISKLNNTYSGGTTVNAGSLVGFAGTFAGGTIYPLGTGPLSISSNATVTVDNSSAGNYNYYGGGAISGSGTIVFIGNGVNRLMVNTVNFSGFTGTITIGGTSQPVELDGSSTTATLIINAGAILDSWSNFGQPTFGVLLGGGIIQGVSGGGGNTVNIGNGGGNGTFSGVIQDNNGTIHITKTGAGTQVLSGLNTSSGKATINGGTLEIGGTGYLGGGSYGGMITISTNTFFAYNSSQSQTLSGTITGSGALVIGAGTVNITGNANNISGPTTVSGGTLIVNNTSGSGTGTGAVTLSGGTLGGTGTISGLVTVNSGASIAPGNSTGTINVGALTLNSGGGLNFEINSSSDHDLINVLNTNGFTLNGGVVTINGGGGFFSDVGSYALIQYAGTIQGAGSLTLNPANAAPSRLYTFSTSLNPGYLTLIITEAKRGTLITIN